MKKITILLLLASIIFSCKKKVDEEIMPEETTPTTPTEGFPDTVWNKTGNGPHLIFKFKFDSTQVRLDNFGNPSTIPSGHSAYSPKFNLMSSHYIELAPTDFDSLGKGKVLYRAEEVTIAGQNAIRFSKSVVVRENVVFYAVPLSQVTPGTYKWLRLSLAYQNYDIPYKANALPGNHIGTGTVASFVGFRNYVTKYMIGTHEIVPSSSVGGPSAIHPQGYWGFGTEIPGYGFWWADGQAPAGATTVVNPNFTNSPIPAGSCVVTAQFADMAGANQLLTITGSETSDIVVTVSLSTNKSFEFTDPNGDGYYQPENGNENPVDMGIRGMIPKVQY
ncbi:MAG: hypothetical protein IT237_14145 [Bacteroidia bacterium]|nr:hypothetical protein [Bacteroidia bacterium]